MGSEIRWVVGGGLIGEQQRVEDAAAQEPKARALAKGKAKPVTGQPVEPGEVSNAVKSD